MDKVSLVLEGGGMRGIYTAGVLDYFIEKDIYFPYVIGVSAGACHASSYISKQFGRNKKVNIGFIRDHRYLSYRNFLKTGSLFGMDFVFNQIPNQLVPFDYNTFYASPQTFLIGTTDCNTGEPVYFEKNDCDQNLILKALMASSSLPFVSRVVQINHQNLLDGGISDPIPIRKSISDGNKRHVIVLTRNKDYRKKPSGNDWLAKRIYPSFKGLRQAMLTRHELYNNTLEYIDALEQTGKALVLRPTEPVKVGRLEKNPQKLTALYQRGYEDARTSHTQIQAFLGLN